MLRLLAALAALWRGAPCRTHPIWLQQLTAREDYCERQEFFRGLSRLGLQYSSRRASDSSIGLSLPGSCRFQCLGAIACAIGNGDHAFDASGCARCETYLEGATGSRRHASSAGSGATWNSREVPAGRKAGESERNIFMVGQGNLAVANQGSNDVSVLLAKDTAGVSALPSPAGTCKNDRLGPWLGSFRFRKFGCWSNTRRDVLP